MEKPYYPLDLPETVKSLPLQPSVDANIVPPSNNGVYQVSDLMKLAPAALQHKYQSLCTPEKGIKEDEKTEECPQDSTTQSAAAKVGVETITDHNDHGTTEITGDGEVKVKAAGVTAENEAASDQGVTVEGKPEDIGVAVAGGGEKKKKKKRSKAKNPDGTTKAKPAKPTGFEEFYAEGPIAPDVYEEEMNNVYHHNRQFAERIEAAIVRYKEKRKLNSKRGDMLNKYLDMGGVDTSIKQFQGGADKENNADDSDDEFGPDYDGPTIFNVTGIKPVSSIFDTTQGAISKYYNPFAPQNWRVDWQGCARAYLSVRAPYLFGITDGEIIDAFCEVPINFCNYILLHSVCPEYTNELLETQNIARLAKMELRKVYILCDVFPGPLHRALHILTDGIHRELYLFSEEDAAQKIKKGGDGEEDFNEDKILTIKKCKSLIQAAIQILGTPEQIHLLAQLKEGDTIAVLKEEVQSYEVVGIQFPTPDQKKDFEALNFESGPVKPMGFVHVKPWSNPCRTLIEDLTPSEAHAAARRSAKAEKLRLDRLAKGIQETIDNTPTESFMVSTHVLEHVFMGMKFEAVVKEVAGGVRFVDQLKNVYPSFYEVTENMKMLSWRAPKKTERIPPTCDDKEGDDGGEETENVAAD